MTTRTNPPRIDNGSAPSVAYGLSRVSGDKQFKSHLSIENQEAEAKRYYGYMLEPKGVIWGSTFGDDEGVSSKIPTLRRPAAIELDRRLKHGDHVICLAIDRIWRDMSDLVAVTQRWMQRGVTLHFVQEHLIFDGSPNALLQLHLFTALAQWERSKISQRQKDANAARRARGDKTIGNKPAYGKKRGKLDWVDNPNENAILALLLHLRDVQRMPWSAIALLAGRTLTLRKCAWHPRDVSRLVKRAREMGLAPSLNGWHLVEPKRKRFVPQAQWDLLGDGSAITHPASETR